MARKAETQRAHELAREKLEDEWAQIKLRAKPTFLTGEMIAAAGRAQLGPKVFQSGKRDDGPKVFKSIGKKR